MPDRPMRHRMPEAYDPVWGPQDGRWPDNTPDWFEPYQTFLEKYSPAFRKTRWRRFLSGLGFPLFQVTWGNELDPNMPGDADGVTVRPRLIQLSLPVRWNLFREFYYRPSEDVLKKWRLEGALILFRQVAYAEFWLELGLVRWPLAWLRNKAWWAGRAEERARELLDLWEWNEALKQNRLRGKAPEPPF